MAGSPRSTLHHSTRRGKTTRCRHSSNPRIGSAAHDETGPDNDVDILVSFDGPATSRRYFGVLFYLEGRRSDAAVYGKQPAALVKRGMVDIIRNWFTQERK